MKTSDETNSFWGMLGSDREEDAQQYLSRHQDLLVEALGLPRQAICIPKFRFGSDFISDFTFLIATSGGSYDACLVEIEPPTARLFTKSGSFAKRLNQAVGQVGDWLAWYHDNSTYFFKSLLKAVRQRTIEESLEENDRPSTYWREETEERLGAVYTKILIGRGRSLPLADKTRKLALYRQTSRQIEIATYDRLVRLAILRSPTQDQLPLDAIREAVVFGEPEVRRHIARTTSNPEILQQLLALADSPLKVSLARNPNLPRHLWDKLVQDENSKVRRTAGLEGAYFSNAVLTEAALDSNPFTREQAAKHPELRDPELIAKLADDEKWYVRQAVLENKNATIGAAKVNRGIGGV